MTDSQPNDEAAKTPPRLRKRYLLVLLAVLLFAILARQFEWLPQPQGQASQHHAVGTQLEVFELQPLYDTDSPVNLKSLQGKVSLVNFWGPWCVVCRKEFPELMELRRSWSDSDDFEFISVSCAARVGGDQAELRTSTAGYLRANQYKFPVYCDPLARMRIMFEKSIFKETWGYPTTLILDQTGKIRGVWTGYTDSNHQEMESLLNELLGS